MEVNGLVEGEVKVLFHGMQFIWGMMKSFGIDDILVYIGDRYPAL